MWEVVVGTGKHILRGYADEKRVRDEEKYFDHF